MIMKSINHYIGLVLIDISIILLLTEIILKLVLADSFNYIHNGLRICVNTVCVMMLVYVTFCDNILPPVDKMSAQNKKVWQLITCFWYAAIIVFFIYSIIVESFHITNVIIDVISTLLTVVVIVSSSSFIIIQIIYLIKKQL